MSETRIAVVRFEALGDLILLTPILRSLSEHFGVPIDVVVAEQYVAVFRNLSFVGETIPFADTTTIFKHLEFLRRFHSRNYEIIIDTHSSFRGWRRTSVTALSPGALKVGYRRKLNIGMDVLVESRIYDRHYIESYASLIEALGVRLREPVPELGVSEEERVRARVILEKANGGKALEDYVILYPGARLQYKQWPARYFSRLGDALIREWSGKVVLLGGVGEEHLVRGVAAEMSCQPLVVPVGVDLRLMFAIIDHCALFISTDTGPKHAAVALRKPVLAIHGSSDPRVWGPYKREYEVIVDDGLPCRPCNNLRLCPRGTSECLTRIQPIEVAERALRLLRERRGTFTARPSPISDTTFV